MQKTTDSFKPSAVDKFQQAFQLHQQGQLEQAEALYAELLKEQPHHIDALHFSGVLANQLGHAQRAVDLISLALKINPNNAAAHSNLGLAFYALKHFDEALASYNRALALKPNNAETHYNCGNVLLALNRFNEALISYNHVLSIKPDHADAHWGASWCYLLLGDLDRGWKEYEWRWQTDDFKNYVRHFSKPQWFGEESLQGKTILLHNNEQGLGDTLQFCRYAKQVADLGAQVILEVPKTLVALLAKLEGVTELIAQGSILPAFDFHCPLLSLPLAFKTRLDSIPANSPYLFSESDKVKQWQSILGEKTKLRIGLVWTGNPAHKNDHNRSLALHELLPLLISNCQFISLQKELHDTDRALLVQQPLLQHYGEQINDFTDTAALCELMDLVISVDTSVAHLAAAMGKPTWILLPYSPDWRWLMNRCDSPWYPTVRLFRQSQRGDWRVVIERLQHELINLPAIESLQQSQSIDLFPQAFSLHQQGQLAQADALYTAILKEQPQHIDALHFSGVLAHQRGQSQHAVDLIRLALELNPNNAAAHSNLGLVLKTLNRFDEALASYDHALALNPNDTEALSNRGIILQTLKRLDEALDSYERALAIKPDLDFVFGAWLHLKMNICDWYQFDQHLEQLNKGIEHGEKIAVPFTVLSLSSSAAVQKKAAEIYTETKYPHNFLLPPLIKHTHSKIRVGYFSSDFRHHAVASLTANLFEQHDRSRFEIIAFSFSPADHKDEMRLRLESTFDQFIDVNQQSDEQVVQLARELEIDIAVDLNAFTEWCRTNIFAMRAAPIQVNYLGYPGTMGADYMDYLIASPILIPTEYQHYYSEKIAYLPNNFMINADGTISDKKFTRAEFGLPEQGFVFCCFNNNYKITPTVFASWMRILHQVKNSVLWLLEDNNIVAKNLRLAATTQGIAAERLIFAKRLLMPEYLARHRVADLFLDTLPYNAHTTASLALWSGLPVLTCVGETFASRMAAGLLDAIGLPELITSNAQNYEALAVKLATHPQQLVAIKQKLAAHRLSSPLFNSVLYTQNIEAVFQAMFDRYQAGLAPEHIYISKQKPQDSVEVFTNHEPSLMPRINDADALYNQGNELLACQQFEQALNRYDQALAIQPNHAEALSNRGIALQYLGRYEQALAINPDYEFLFGTWLYMKMTVCDWNQFDQHLNRLTQGIEQGKKLSIPFFTQVILSSPALQKKAAEIYVLAKYPSVSTLPPIAKHAHTKIKIAYFSSDFRQHPIAYLMAELFERHDRSRFEIIAFSFHASHQKDDMRLRLEATFDRFIDVSQQTDEQVVQLARQLEIDIAIDLNGFTEGCRPNLFVMRVAPIQASYLGYLGTMGADYMDYLLADKTLIPVEHQIHYREKIVYLPNSFQVNDSELAIADKKFSRTELGLPEQGFVFCCFNNNYKITPQVFDSWMRILQQVKGSVLWLLGDNPTAENNLRLAATARGIAAKRLIFAKCVSMPEYLARHHVADLFLNTQPYNAGATASAALWAGLPVLTCLGETFAGRMGASLLNAVGLPELITHSLEDYEKLAIQLATHSEQLAAIKQKLATNRLTCPLFDTDLFTQHLEQAYQIMFERYQAGLKPDHIDVVRVTATPPQIRSSPANNEIFQQALSLHQQGQLATAEKLYQQILQTQPQHADALHFLGVLKNQNGQAQQAVDLIKLAIQIQPDNVAAHSNLGLALHELQHYEQAIASYDRALAIKPNNAEAHYNRGNALLELKHFDEAIACYDRALTIKSDYAEAFSNRGNALRELKRLDEALASYERALSIKPHYAEALAGYAAVLQDFKRLKDAIINYERALAIKPDLDFIYGTLLYLKMNICDWHNFDANLDKLINGIEREQKIAIPFSVLLMSSSADLQQKVAEFYTQTKHPSALLLPTITKRKHTKIKLAYFSADFRHHPVAYLTAGLFEHHDRSQFEVIAFSLHNAEQKDDMRLRLEAAFDSFIDVSQKSDQEIVALARELEIDIAVDLNGCTDGGRTSAFAMRLAPIQVNYLGYSGTMGAEYMDYLIGDTVLIPKEYQPYYTEKIAYLPNSYMANDDTRAISNRQFTRTELGLPERGFVFCCFNNAYKITPVVFDIWMQLLLEVKDSVLWLSAGSAEVVSNLQQEASERGIAANRIIFAERLPSLADHLARHRLADLFLDTAPYNAHTTTSDALWAGLPVLTCVGEAYASRVAASLLTAVGLPELITTSHEDYQTLAIQLATHPKRLNAIKQKLAENRLSYPLFNTALFTQHIESAYKIMLERYQADLAPDYIYISAPKETVKKQPSRFNPINLFAKWRENRSNKTELSQKAPTQADELFEEAQKLHHQGQLAAAETLYEELLKIQPDHAEALRNLAVLKKLHKPKPVAQKADIAMVASSQTLNINPNQLIAVHINRGLELQNLNRLQEALISYDCALGIDANHVEVLVNRGKVLEGLGRLELAQASYERALSAKPDHAEALRCLNALKKQRVPDIPIIASSQSLSIKPDILIAVHLNKGQELQNLGHLNDALASYDSALAITPNHVEALINRGNVLEDLERLNEALASYDRAISAKPDYARAHSNRGNVLQSLKRFDEAIASYDRAIAIKPDYAEAFYNRGNALQANKLLPEALASYERALSIKPDFMQALISRGNLLHDRQNFADALQSYDRALAIRPDYAEALYNRGNVLIDLKRLDDALISYERALAIKPDYGEALVGRGVILQDSKRINEALLSYERALAIKPDLEFTFGDWLILKMSICAWDKLDNHFQQLAEGIMRGKKMAIPFLVHSVSSSAALQQKAAQTYAQAKYPSVSIPALVKHHHAKIKLGYFSADFRHHPVAYLTAELFERHDRERFEVIAFSFHDTRQKDEMRLRLEAAFDSFIDVSQKSDDQIVQLARQLEIDIAIDLTGLTKGSRTQLFAMRIAPIQVNYLGFSGTMGVEYMDYLLADSVVIPSEYQHYYTEKIAYLPNSYMVNDSTRAISNKAFTRTEFGLPEQGFVFCCFNHAYKITPTVFAIWMRLLNKIDGSVLWLSENNADSIDNLQREAQKHGIAPERLIFAKRLPLLADHLARHRLADLFLDTLPYNAHTTSSDALWAGLPVLTCTGEAFASRVAASLLTAVGLPELITSNHEDYEALAIQLATHSEQLATLKQKLADNRLSYPLFNTTLFTQHIESAYQTMFDRYQADLPPTQFYVSAQIDTPVIDATEADALINKGNELEDGYRLVEALEHYERAISMNSNYARAYSNQGNVLQSLQRFNEALASYNRALAIKPNYAEALYNRGNTLQALKRLDEALDNYDKALTIKPNLFVALIGQGNVLQDLKQFEQALKSYDRALAIQPDDLALLISRSSVLQRLKRYDEALANYDRILSIQADYLAAWIDRGVVLQTLKRFEEAVSSYDRALAIKPDHAEVLAYRGIILQMMGRLNEAIDSCERALKIQPDYEFLFGTWLHSKMKICDWRDFDANLKQLQEKITLGKKPITPFALQALSFSLDLQKKAASAYAEAKYPSAPLLPLPAKHTHSKIKLAYFSADFRQHPVAYLMAELFELHDRSRFEVLAFSLQSPHHKDELRLRLESAFDSFIDVSEKSDEQIVQLARKLEIDIAIDLNGFTEGRRSSIFAMRAAPIQVSYLGYLGTMGVDYIDYLLADSTLIPAEHQPYYSEKIAYLPHSFQVNDSKQPIADKIFTRAELGLPEQSFVFCCFNNNFKLTPVIFDAWMRILHQVENSVLWLVVDHVGAETNLRLAATARGIAADRIIFAKRLPLPEYLARHRVADLFLDTQPYNAGATASASLWAGLPVLTYLGETFAGRMGASLLNAIGLPELIADNLEDYENLAIQLATHPEQLAAIKQKLANNRLNHPLFDTALFTQHIEQAYQMMFDRYQADLAPDHIVVPAQINTLIPVIELEALDEIINQGNELEDLNRLEEALASYDRAISINPNYARAHSNRGNVLQSLNRFDEAIKSYDYALNIKPNYAEVFYNRGNALQASEKLAEAIVSYEQALRIKPDFIQALISLGNALHDCGRFSEALSRYERALNIQPDHAEVLYNRGNVLYDLKRYAEAIESYHRALIIRPNYAGAHWNSSFCHLMLGDFETGWQEYEWRWKSDESKDLGRNFSKPQWFGDTPLQGKTILLHSEQGLGDTLQFCRYVVKVAELGAKVILEVQQPLFQLLTKLEGIDQIVIQGNSLPAFDLHCPLLSLPLAFKTRLDSIPINNPYLFSDPDKVKHWQAILGEKTLPRIGLVWSGRASQKNDHNRSLPLPELLPLLKLAPHCQFISLQKELRDTDKELLAQYPTLLNYGEQLNDFTDTAAIIELLDVVISVCTSVAHLAAAMGKPTWILLSDNACWRWLLNREDSPWYPTVRLFRQSQRGHWQSVIEQVNHELIHANTLNINNTLVINSETVENLINQGNTLKDLNPHNEALAIAPDYAETHYNIAKVLQEQKRLNEALKSYDRALTLKADYAEALIGRGAVLQDLNRLSDALYSYEHAWTLQPDLELIFCVFLSLKMKLCDWRDFEAHLELFKQKINRNETIFTPFFAHIMTASASLQQKVASRYAQAKYPSQFFAPPLIKHPHSKIKLAYFSADFRDHAVALFKGHDRSRFEVIAFSLHITDHKDPKLESCFDRFIDVSQQSDEQVVKLARELEIDIAVDLTGFTEGCRTNLFAMRVAPIQVNYLGFSGTMGAEYMDYLIADAVLIPKQYQPYYSEKIAYLPNSYMVCDSDRPISNRPFTRTELGLPEQGFVFCCFNNHHKITPLIFDSWMRILQQVENSVLWLSSGNSIVISNLKHEAKARGIAHERLVFANRLPLLSEHLARHRLADLFLDSLPYNAHTTSNDALWAGLPVLTCTGEAYASRVSASLLTVLGLPELITTQLEDYETLAIQLATHPEQLAAIKQKLANNRLNTPLFNTALFTQHIESAYQMMFERYQADLPPDYIYVETDKSTPVEQPVAVDDIINQGNELEDLNRLTEALACYDRAIAINPNYARAYSNRGNVLQSLKRFDEALASYDKALAIRPDYAEAFYNRGNTLQACKRLQDAIASYDRALTLKPDLIQAFISRGNALHDCKRLSEALANYDQALAIYSDYAEAYINRGVVLKDLKRYDEALASYERALSINPNYADALVGRGAVFQDLKRVHEAITSYEHALAIEPNHDFLLGTWLHLKMTLCDWDKFEQHLNQLVGSLKRGEKVSIPFPVLAMSASAAIQQKVAEIYVQEKFSSYVSKPIPKHKHPKIKIGYFSSDFRNHPVAYLMAGIFEHHDRSRFEVIAFSFSPSETKDEMRLKLEGLFDSFIDVSQQSDEQVVQLARQLEIDIAVDLNGFTQYARTELFALRVAPIQVNYLGYSGTTGAEYMDYLLADEVAIPSQYQAYYTEKIAYLPNSYMANDNTRAISDRNFTRTELGLPEQGFVFCCFNNSYKITPAMFAVWMRILQQVKDSVLWLSESNTDVVSNLQSEANKHGITANRLIFAKRLPSLADHLARHRLADLFLDTLPYNAHTTSSDALWAGLPVLTCAGVAFASRVAASLLSAIGLPELITDNLQDYEQLAIQLATHPEQLKAIKQKLAENRLTHPLFDTTLFTQHIEAAYQAMYDRYQGDLPPDHIKTNAVREASEIQASVALPDNATFLQAFELHQLGQLEQAENLYKATLQAQPQHAEALHLWGVLAIQRGQAQLAVDLISQSLNIHPNNPEANSNIGLAFQALNRFDEALASYERALSIQANHVEALYNRGNLLLARKLFAQALADYDRVLNIQPNYAEALCNRGIALQKLNRLDEALTSYDRALAIKPDYAEVLTNRGNVLKDLKRWNEAIDNYDQALAIATNDVETLINRGNALQELKRYDDALASYQRALVINPNYAEALCHQGIALQTLNRWHEAVTSYEQALAINPDYSEALCYRGVALQELKRWDEALASYERALAINPNHEFLFGSYLTLKMKICDWRDLEQNIQQLKQKIAHEEKAIAPFGILAVSASAALHKKVAEIYIAAKHPSAFLPPSLTKHSHSKIKLAYFSADFYHHATAHLMAELFERHDKSRFEIIAFSFNPKNDKDETRLRLEAAFDKFIDVSQQSDEQVVRLARELEIDIAVDLKGFTQYARLDLFAMRVAPIQVNYLGYPGTMGADYIDYLLADSILIPTEYQTYYSEKIVYLPNSYQVNDSTRFISDRQFTRAELGLPEQGFVFCCFNNNYKITPEVFDCWTRLLQQVEGSVLWLLSDNTAAETNLKLAATTRGISEQRLVFAQRLPLHEHLARHRLADLFLDTQPCNAHTTASDALWAGLPVLTCIGEVFASRVAASLLNAIGLPELITDNLEDYEKLAIQLATHPEQLARLKQKLADNRLTSPLFDTVLFTRHIEAAYQAMYDRYQADLVPEHIEVSTDKAGDTYSKQSVTVPINTATFLQAVELHQQGQFEQAEALYKATVQAQPEHADALHLWGVLAIQRGQARLAVDLISQSLNITPNNAQALSNIGLAFQALNRPDEALASYERALSIQPNYVEALYNRGNLLLSCQRFDEALANYDRALSIQPNYAEILCNRGITLQKLKRLNEALVSYDQALTIKPDYAEVFTNRGNVLKDLKHWNEAINSYDCALAVNPNDVETLTNRGNVLQELKRYDEALANYERALTIKPDDINALSHRGIALQELHHWHEALSCYQKVLNIDPEYEFLLGTWLSLKMKMCDWSEFDTHIAKLTQKIQQGAKASTPLFIQSISSSRALQKKVAEIYVQAKYPSALLLPPIAKHSHSKIKIAYFSADFRYHPVSYLTAELFARHDRTRFEVIAFSFSPNNDKDEIRLKLEGIFDSFIDVSQQPDEQVVRLARQMEIDIAIDLNGFTQYARTGLFAMRVAPIQVNYLGYLGTMGVDYIDYLLADSTLIPTEHQPHYSEKIAYLPHSFQVNDSKQPIADKIFTRAELGLPEQSFVFCCFNNNFKITPVIFDAWMRILHQVENSVLWLVVDHVGAETNLRLAATARGITADRIIFAKRLPLPEYLARHRVADLFLDTQPYNAGATASASLWAGLPVLAYLGETFAGRMGASLLNAIGLPELIADNLQDYENLAIQLATHPEQLAAIKQKLADNRLTYPLFDTALFTQHIEAAYQAMFDRYQAGLAPDHIHVNVSHAAQIQPSPDNAAKFSLAMSHHQQGQLAAAEALYQEILQAEPNHVDALHFLGVLKNQNGQPELALELIKKSIQLYPNNPAAHSNLGIALQALNRFDEALMSYNQVLALTPEDIEILLTQGNLLLMLHRFNDALIYYDRVLAIDNHHAEALFSRANVLYQLKRLEEAVSSYDRSLAINPNSPEAYYNRGIALRDLNRINDAIASYQQALTIKPDYVEVHNNLASLLKKQDRFVEAIASYQHAIAIKPDYVDAHCNLINLLNDLGRVSEAKTSLNTALANIPDSLELHNLQLILTLPMAPKTATESALAVEQFDKQLSEFSNWLATHSESLKKNSLLPLPFLLAYRTGNHVQRLSRYGDLMAVASQSLVSRVTRTKLKMVVISHHFRRHSVWDVITRGLLVNLDRSRFELVLYHLGNIEDQETAFAKSLTDEWRDTQTMTGLNDWLSALHNDAPDIIFYPEIGMDPMTARLAAHRIAPLQVASWGHPITTGLPTIDLYFSGELLESNTADSHYRERLIRLPSTGCCTTPIQISPEPSLELEAELAKRQGVRFVIAQTSFKFEPADDALYAEIASLVGDSTFILLRDSLYPWASDQIIARLEQSFIERGLNPKQHLLLIAWQSVAKFQSLLDLCDVYLDCPSFSGYTTAWQAAHHGLPIVTLEGEFMRQRLAAGLLRKIGITDTIASTREEYVQLAVKLAKESQNSSYAARREALKNAAPKADNDVSVVKAFEQSVINALANISSI